MLFKNKENVSKLHLFRNVKNILETCKLSLEINQFQNISLIQISHNISIFQKHVILRNFNLLFKLDYKQFNFKLV